MASTLVLAAMLIGCRAIPGDGPPVVAVDAAPGVAFQARRSWWFASDRIRFDNRITGARLNDVERIGPHHYRVRIDPETRPINPSPWYGFRVASEVPAHVRIEVDYGGAAAHRYHPKLGTDGVNWRDATATEFLTDPPRLQLSLPQQPLLVFAQRPVPAAALTDWSRSQAAALGVPLQAIGASVQGRTLHLFEFGGSESSELVVVVGRQHPPETTGSRALTGFVQALAADTDAARAYRHRFRTLVVPLLNPDGVVEGHWRGNANGRDLNRDWGPFEQPETRALRDALRARSGDDPHRIVFAIDFHSTWNDVLYTVADAPSLAEGGLLRDWIDAMQRRFPDRIREQSFAATTSVFKNWVHCTFGAPSVTYEVGDETQEATLHALSAHAAYVLMQRLEAHEHRRPPVDTNCPPPD